MSDDKRLDKIETHLESMSTSLRGIEVTLAKQAESLEIHIKRTDALEDVLTSNKASIDMAKGAIALIGLLALLAGIYEAFKH